LELEDFLPSRDFKEKPALKEECLPASFPAEVFLARQSICPFRWSRGAFFLMSEHLPFSFVDFFS